jgi:cell division protein FtsW (lipid II flippase)
VRRHKGNRLVLILTLILIAFGMIMIYIIGPLRAQQLGEANESVYFIGQIKAVAVSLVLFFWHFR